MRMTTEELHRLLDADFATGQLTWKPRPREMFSSYQGYRMWNAKYAGKPALACKHIDGYLHGAINKQLYLAHRVLYAMKHGCWPLFIDHINGNRSDNSIDNLRAASRTDNARNQKKPVNNKSGYVGVSWNNRDRRWAAYITINRKRKALGNFVCLQDAINRRLTAQRDAGFHANHGRA